MAVLLNIVKFILNFVYCFFKLFKRRKQITMISRQSNKITPDFSLLEKELKKELKDYKIVILCKTMDNKLLYSFHMLKQMYHISRSELVILDSYCVLIGVLKHKKGLKVIQMWHALGLMKKAGYAILDKKEGRNSLIANVMGMHKNYDYVFTTSVDCINSMSQVFGCDKEIISSVPLPRIDLLNNKSLVNKKKKEILEKYPVLKEKINVLYAPTFRKNEELMKEEVIKLCKEFNYKKYNLIIKLHPLSKINIDNNKVIMPKFTTTEMMYVSDYIISDYSSVIYEAGILNKKLIFFAFDLDMYKDTRDLFVDYKNEIPGPLCKSAKEVLNFLKKPEYKEYKNRNLISKYVDVNIDNYTINMVNKIVDIIKNNNRKKL